MQISAAVDCAVGKCSPVARDLVHCPFQIYSGHRSHSPYEDNGQSPRTLRLPRRLSFSARHHMGIAIRTRIAHLSALAGGKHCKEAADDRCDLASTLPPQGTSVSFPSNPKSVQHLRTHKINPRQPSRHPLPIPSTHTLTHYSLIICSRKPHSSSGAL